MSADTVKELREITGAGVMECKKALEDAGGNLEKAKALVFERGLARADKKAERVTGSGLIVAYVHNDRVGVLVKIKCETDFVARLEDFKELGHNIAMQIAAMEPANVEELLAQTYIKDASLTIENLIKNSIAKIGENIQVDSFCRYVL